MPAGSKVFLKFPKTGLGNMLLVWANALLFAKINGLPLIVSSWWGIRWGTLLRRERKRRMYRDYFIETPLVKRLSIRFGGFSRVDSNPSLSIIPADNKDAILYKFDKIITHEDMFLELYPYKKYITGELYAMLHPKQRDALTTCTAPAIAVHIRRGDFKIAHRVTPLSYFIKAIMIIRETVKADLPVTIFTDAEAHELKELTSMEAVHTSPDKPDILDILLMSKSRFIILSQSSTFSYWSAFLSDAFVIMPHDDWQHRLKPDESSYREVRWDASDDNSTRLLKNALISAGAFS